MIRRTSASTSRAVSSLKDLSAPYTPGAPRYGFWRGESSTKPSVSLIPHRVHNVVAQPPARHHAAGERGGLLDVVFGTGGSRTVHHLFRRAPAEHADDA